MRISLHIVVALLLIALIYREILKGILPPVCGNHWQACSVCQIHGCLHLCPGSLISEPVHMHVIFLSLSAESLHSASLAVFGGSD